MLSVSACNGKACLLSTAEFEDAVTKCLKYRRQAIVHKVNLYQSIDGTYHAQLPWIKTRVDKIFRDGTCRRSPICSKNYGAASFNQDISNWNVTRVVQMHYMFFEASRTVMFLHSPGSMCATETTPGPAPTPIGLIFGSATTPISVILAAETRLGSTILITSRSSLVKTTTSPISTCLTIQKHGARCWPTSAWWGLAFENIWKQ